MNQQNIFAAENKTMFNSLFIKKNRIVQAVSHAASAS